MKRGMHSLPDETRERVTAEHGVLLAGAISGIFYFVVAWARPPDGPGVETATAAEIRAFLSENGTALRLGALVGALAIPTVLVFTVCVARLVRRRLPGSVLADLITAGGVLIAVLHWLVAATAGMTLVQALDGTDLATVDDATLRSWYGLANLSHFLFDLGLAPVALVMVASSVAGLRAGFLPRWLSWLGLAFGTAGALGTAGVAIAWKPLALPWFGGLAGWVLWTLLVGVTLGLRWRRLRRRREGRREGRRRRWPSGGRSRNAPTTSSA
jgi:hypothetical protein